MLMYRTKRARLLAVLLAALLGALLAVPSPAFAAWRHWSYDAVKKCESYGILDSSNFDPDEEITRGEFCKMVNLTFNLSEATGGRVFPHGAHYPAPFAKDMLIASAAGYMQNAGGTKGPNEGITREQAFTALAAALRLDGDAAAKTPFQDDADISAWARGPVNALLNAGYITRGGKPEPPSPKPR